METVSNKNDLLGKFWNVFLAVSETLQDIKVTQKVQNNLLRSHSETLGIIYGYFVEFEPNQNRVVYFIDDKASSRQGDVSFEPPLIEYFYKSSKRNDLYAVLYQSENKFDSILRAPKLYQHLPIQPIHSKKYKQISDDYLNCFIPNTIRGENDYYVVLFDEIVFFQFAYCYKTGRNFYDFYKEYKHLPLIYLLKFALSVEQKMGRDALHKELGLENSKEEWNTRQEVDEKNGIRKKIEKIVTEDNFNKKEWVTKVNDLVKDVVERLLEQSARKEIYKKFPENIRDIEILKHLTRFDIEASLRITDETNRPIFHDVFVFPLYTETQSIYSTKFIVPDSASEVSIHSPILLVLYIKTLYELTNQKEFDESLSSIKGFQLTKEIAKLFAEKLIQEEYLKNVVKKALQPVAIRAAISQVMARNTSHNIGAHVMNKLIGNLRELNFLSYKRGKNYSTRIELKKDIHKDIVDRLKANAAFKTFDRKTKIQALRNELLLGQIAIFNNYLKCRIDYLADISFGTPLMQTNKFAYFDLFKELDKVRLLLEHISGLGENFIYEIKFRYNHKVMDDDNDLLVSIPNDILGVQAFYNILENIIRNTAKHAKQKPLVTTFTVNFLDRMEQATEEQQNVMNDFIIVEAYDNIAVNGTGRNLTIEEKNEYERVTAPASAPASFASEIDALVFLQNSIINTDILQDRQLRSGALGVIEMDASAAYLRKRDVSYINHDNYAVRYDDSWSSESVLAQNNEKERGTDCRHFLKAFKKDISKPSDKNPAFALGYRFFLLRPQVVLIVGDFNSLIDKISDQVKELKKMGVSIVAPADFQKHLTEGKVYNHEFLLYAEYEKNSDDETFPVKITELIKNNRTALPLRILEVAKENLNALLFGTKEQVTNHTHEKQKFIRLSATALEKHCWEKWSEKLLKNNPCSEKIKDESHKCSWRIGSSYNSRTCNSIVFLNHADKFSAEGNHLSIENLSTKGFYSFPESRRYQNMSDFYFRINKDEISSAKLLDSAITKVLVIDERIQSAGEKETFMGTEFKKYYKGMGITIPEMDLSSTVVDENWKLGFDNLFKAENLEKYDFVLVHYSLLERRFESAEKAKLIDKLLNESVSEKTRIVVTSGRGIPKALTPNVSFVNLSSVIAAFIEVRSKFAINNLLYSSRKAKLV